MAEEKTAFNLVNIVVTDMEASVAFYRRLGLKIPDADPAWDDVHRSAKMPDGIGLDLDAAGFASKWDQGWRGGPGVVLGFSAPSRDAVDATYADLTGAGYRGQQPPYDAFWGARYAVVEDPDGNAVGLMSEPDPARRAAPPSA
ncbi:MAG TPA: VOC family protein [Dehalococcoidia bacterium]|nr:VOC family protein [Dehalococcoidia bacterium]